MSKSQKDAVAAVFASFYLQRATAEFAEDLDRLRTTADDFKGDAAVAVLVAALRQGAATFAPDEQRRVVEAGAGDGAKGK